MKVCLCCCANHCRELTGIRHCFGKMSLRFLDDLLPFCIRRPFPLLIDYFAQSDKHVQAFTASLIHVFSIQSERLNRLFARPTAVDGIRNLLAKSNMQRWILLCGV
jgi:hypothetical protein